MHSIWPISDVSHRKKDKTVIVDISVDIETESTEDISSIKDRILQIV